MEKNLCLRAALARKGLEMAPSGFLTCSSKLRCPPQVHKTHHTDDLNMDSQGSVQKSSVSVGRDVCLCSRES